MDYSARERFCLLTLAVFGFVGVNGVFVWALLLRPGLVREALANPVAAAFVVEALVMVAALAYLLRRWGVSRLPWGWFVALCLLGGIAFALPVALLWGRGRLADPGLAR